MKRSRLRALARGRSGATAVEFALVAPMFLALVFGTIEFGRLLWTEQALQQTAIAGARCVAIAQGKTQNSPCASGGTTTYVQNVAKGWGVTLATITPNTSASCGAGGGFSEMTLTSTFNSVAPGLVQLATGGITLTASACYPNNS
ncbi:MAG TPA: TadE/TadG family type IV pilus assembly protein [Stellaceae bacterium]|jgi:Flp pilus assembly protein TadG